MRQILVLAKDMRAARHEAQYLAYKIAHPSEWRETHGEVRSLDRSIAIFYAAPELAQQQMVGLRLAEIIIFGDWTRWRFGGPGAFASWSQSMKVQMAQGATRRWV